MEVFHGIFLMQNEKISNNSEKGNSFILPQSLTVNSHSEILCAL